MRDILHLAPTGWTQVEAEIHCSERATGQPLLSTCPKFERAVDFLLRGEKLLPVDFYSLDIILSGGGLAQLALQENEPRFPVSKL